MFYLCSKNKDADQLGGYRVADLRLCFLIYAKIGFSYDVAHITLQLLQLFKDYFLMIFFLIFETCSKNRLWVHVRTPLCLDYISLLDFICCGYCTIYLSTIFCTIFRHRRHDCWLYGHRAISLTGFFNRLVQSCRQTVQRLCNHRAVSAAVHKNRTDIHTKAMLRSEGGCVILVYFWKFV